VYKDPSLLWNAQNVHRSSMITVNGNQASIAGNSGTSGVRGDRQP